MAIKRKDVRSIVVLYPQGRFYGGDETDEVETAIMAVAAEGNSRLILNMREVMFIATGFMSVLIRARANYEKRQGEVKLCTLVDTVERSLHIPKLLSKFDHHQTEEEAIAAFIETVTER